MGGDIQSLIEPSTSILIKVNYITGLNVHRFNFTCDSCNCNFGLSIPSYSFTTMKKMLRTKKQDQISK